jgi:predicted secreted protein
MRYALLALSGALIMSSFTATATLADDGLNLPPEGHTLLNLSASEQMTLPQDLLMASLRIEAKSADSSKVQNDINTAMEKALAMGKKVDGVKVSTGGYHVYEQYVDKNVKVWQGQQTIQLESKDSAALLKLAGEIQKAGFLMNGLNYTLSPEKAESVRDELMVKALKKLQDKAAMIAKALGKSGYDLTDVNVDGASPMPMPMYKTARMEMAMASDAGMAAPVAEAGETDVSLSVSARVLLKP